MPVFFGAWAAQKIAKLSLSSPRILDIGTGTGLLSLMIAQQLTDFSITAIEIDEAAALQAKDNFNKSPWSEHLFLKKADINLYSNEKQFDVIISNPPFYERDLRANSPAKNQAFHDSSLTLSTLLIASLKLFETTGISLFDFTYNKKGGPREILFIHGYKYYNLL